ncbi:helix-turn-helix domain-containing protein [Chelatococcus sp. SYSU_G07232]|uniref:Helix-turn-helix domain-containing protein n=1 Tax=Chelatococcus albus TaxID=3047466 RepID=A0ABT7AGA0_9HYPH|nr:helix-turn-helix domain-containing protein [Chelatococcus sp. SYSU_G07232]MDJ1158403.1 helix-turn-helix domain-containing protein [Chelatococcus sp. SYSU_G07232]
MTMGVPQFHLYGEDTDDEVFDFIHVETIVARSSRHNWIIAPHRHRHLFQVLILTEGGGTATYEESEHVFAAPCVLLVPPLVVHGFRFTPGTVGHIASFTEDVVRGAAEARGNAYERLIAAAAEPVLELHDPRDADRLCGLIRDLHDERFLAREGHALAMRALVTLIAIEVGRLKLAAARSRSTGAQAPVERSHPVVDQLKGLIEDHYRHERQIGFYAARLAMTPDRLNDHVKRIAGVTVGHLIRHRLLTEAKRQLVFTTLAASEIAYDLGFADPSHFSRFFRKHAGLTPQEFREGRRGGR